MRLRPGCRVFAPATASVRAMVVGWRSHDRTVAGCSVCAIVALCATVAVAVPLVLPFGAYPVIARTTSTVCDRRDGITVCVWPVSRLPTCPGNLVEMDM